MSILKKIIFLAALVSLAGCKTVVVFSANRYFEDEQTHTAAEIRMEKEW